MPGENYKLIKLNLNKNKSLPDCVCVENTIAALLSFYRNDKEFATLKNTLENLDQT